ncbi:MAG: DNA mismatch repair protein MutS [Armatimonadota bacterium]|nr:DNA mismatch repair protein MutS [Armatimonadota bacterium]MDR7568304.1 DNA mismatch repair protein MutS [Armatimonadota bacterium]MDR7603023.1 DNA mismatch repair protein MutS [Armatimonadota bacterium]
MKARLLYPDADFDWTRVQQAVAERVARRTGHRSYRAPESDPRAGLPANAEDLKRDLNLAPLLSAMAQEDDWIHEVSWRILLGGVRGDPAVIGYRQDILRDCLQESEVARRLYALTVEAAERTRGPSLGVLSRYPDWVLRDAAQTLERLLPLLRELREIAVRHGPRFRAEGWVRLFTTLRENLIETYLEEVQGHLQQLQFPHGVLLSAQLGMANKGTHYRLHRVPDRRRTLRDWWRSLFGESSPVYRFDLSPRDEAGARALQELRSRAIASVADALGRAADHVRDFFAMLRAELAFYMGCLNLHEALTGRGYPTCFPRPASDFERRLSFRGLYDATLALTGDGPVVPNDLEADGKSLIFITGPNAGGKTTFLRSFGIAQLLMQSGVFVPAQSFAASLCTGLFTHFKREEDTALERGKLDEELRRMSAIVDQIHPGAVLLCNESFSATNEREGSEIARQILRALTAHGIRVCFVTHFYDLARSFHDRELDHVLFLRAERLPDGRRTYRILPGEPLPTSHGEDVYSRVFGDLRTERVHAIPPLQQVR